VALVFDLGVAGRRRGALVLAVRTGVISRQARAGAPGSVDMTAVIAGVGVVSAFDRRDAGPRCGALVLDTGIDGDIGAVVLAREATEDAT
jgi:hypothetical protein